jgi:class 3 adenylate cyclase
MALHTGDVELRQGQYAGSVLPHAVRLLRAAAPTQILLSEATAILLRQDLEPGVRLRDGGLQQLADAADRERLYQVEQSAPE